MCAKICLKYKYKWPNDGKKRFRFLDDLYVLCIFGYIPYVLSFLYANPFKGY